MGLAPHSWWSKSKIVAAIAGVVFMTATAAIIVHRNSVQKSPVAEPVILQEDKSPTKAIKVIDFDNVPLTTVVEEIKQVYGVEVANLPEDAASCHLSLHYEGNVCDLIERINEILDTNLEIIQ